ncbi:MAG: MarR family transcriptional regulator [Actinomycetota bacterium]|nr:MarR family transcriptional regulator [Actinomycetota bacterium]
MSRESISDSDADEDVLTLLMRASSGVAERINAAVVDAGNPGLRPAHGLVFTCIAPHGATINHIADRLGVTKQSAAAIVDGLERSGHVTRRPHPSDRRAWLIEPTSSGRQIMTVAAAALDREMRSLRTAVGRRRAQDLREGLRHLAGAAKPRPVW